MKKLLSFLLLCVFGISIAGAQTTTHKTHATTFNGPLASLNFDGTDDWVDLHTPLPTGVNDFTIEFWFKWNGNPNQTIFYNGDPAAGNGYGVCMHNGNIAMVFNGNVYQDFASPAPNHWFHIAVSFGGGSSSSYLNGILFTGAGYGSTLLPAGGAMIGGNTGTSAYSGFIDELRIWNTPLAQSQIKENMYCPITTPDPALIAYYNFDEATPNAANAGITTLHDLSGNGYDGTLTNYALNGTSSNWATDFLPVPFTSNSYVNTDTDYYLTGTPVTFSAGSDLPGENPTYQWMLNGVVIPGATMDTYIDSTLSAGDTVTCLVTSSISCVTSLVSDPVVPAIYSVAPGTILYPAGGYCYTVGNLTFCGVLDPNETPYSDQYGNGGSAIDDASINSTGQYDAYDGALGVAINDSAFTHVPDMGYAGFVDTVNNIIQTVQQPISGLQVSREFRFYENDPIVRLNARLYNPTSSPISVRVNISSNLGSDGNTEMDTCSTGSTSLSDSARWMVTSDGSMYGDPVITTARFGPGTIVSHPYFNEKPENGNTNYDDSLRVIIPPFSTRYVVVFNRLDSLVDAAKVNAGYFDDLHAMINDSMFAGIDTLDNIVNWSLQQSVSSFTQSAPTGCNPRTVNFTNNSMNATMYVWDFGDGSPADSSANPSHQYAPDGYTVTMTASNGNGLDSTITSSVVVNAVAPDMTTSLSGATITSNASGAAYQWIDCGNGNAAISGATGQSYTATVNGNYAVIVSVSGGCTDTSGCVAVNNVGLKANAFSGQVKLYPNPNQGNFTIEVPGSADAVIVIKNALGQVVQKTSTKGSRQILMSIDQAAGVYFVEVSGEDQQKCVIRVIKE